MSPEEIREVGNVIDKLAGKLGVPASEIVAYHAKAIYPKGITFSVIGISCIAFGFYLLRKILKSDDLKQEDLMGFMIISVLIAILGCFIFGVNIGDVFSPESQAYTDLINSIR